METLHLDYRGEFPQVSQESHEIIWGITFLSPNDTALDRYYNTWVIDTQGIWCGLQMPLSHPFAIAGKMIDEFSSIARDLILLGYFERYEEDWRDAFTFALASVVQIQ